MTVGVITELVTVLSWLLNYKAYIHISDDRIKAKYHLFGRLDCHISDVEFALLIIDILVTMILTGERDMYEFSRSDWTVFAAMSVIGIVMLILAFCFAQKAGKLNVPIERVIYEIQRRIIETEPLLPGNTAGGYADEDYMGRVTVFGYSDQSNVYYTIL